MAIILRSDRRAVPVREASSEQLGAAESAVCSIGRVEMEGHPYLPLGRHGVSGEFALVSDGPLCGGDLLPGRGDGGLTLKSEFKVFLSSPPELSETVQFRLPLKSVRFMHPFFQVALCELEEGEITLAAEDQELGLTLAANDAIATAGRKVAVVGFAAPDPRNDPEAVHDAYGDIADVLYHQPGELRGVTIQAGTPALEHDCSTTGGSGGAPLIDVETGLVLGVHYAGMYLSANYAVPSAQLALDRRVRTHGVIFSDDPPWMREWALADAAARQAETAPPPPQPAAPPEVDIEVQHFSQTNLYRLRDMLADAGFAQDDRQYLLFVSMNPRYVSMLPTEGAPAARLLNVLNTINHTPALTNGELPFRTRLVNAVENSKPLPVAAKLQKFLDQLPVA